MSDFRSSQKEQNLARIRDNQRRSRARRKEYIQELETKLRNCEQLGIEASAEIQNAARRVVEENRKLRALLHNRGVSETEVVAALGGSSERIYDRISAVPRLNAALERRITANMLCTTSTPAPPHTRASSMPRHVPSVQPIFNPPPRPTSLSCNESPSPGSMASTMSTPPPPAYPTAFYATSTTSSGVEIKSEDAQYDYPYEQPCASSWPYQNPYNYTTNLAEYYSSSSCVDTTNGVRTARNDAGPEPGVDHGCRIPSQQCYSHNAVLFNMIEKYSQHDAAI